MARKAQLIQSTAGFFSTILSSVSEAIIDSDENVNVIDFLTWLVSFHFFEIYNIPVLGHNHTHQLYLKILAQTKSRLLDKNINIEKVFTFYIKMPKIYSDQEIKVILKDDLVCIYYSTGREIWQTN